MTNKEIENYLLDGGFRLENGYPAGEGFIYIYSNGSKTAVVGINESGFQTLYAEVSE